MSAFNDEFQVLNQTAPWIHALRDQELFVRQRVLFENFAVDAKEMILCEVFHVVVNVLLHLLDCVLSGGTNNVFLFYPQSQRDPRWCLLQCLWIIQSINALVGWCGNGRIPCLCQGCPQDNPPISLSNQRF